MKIELEHVDGDWAVSVVEGDRRIHLEATSTALNVTIRGDADVDGMERIALAILAAVAKVREHKGVYR